MENNIVTYNSAKNIGTSEFVMMGDIRLRQPLPTNEIEMIDPFILLHHYGPFVVNKVLNPLDLGPHPHRGFEPVTFVLQGEQLHRDSLGNESIVRAGDVQWTRAGRGIIHAEGPSNCKLRMQIIVGNLNGVTGKIISQTDVNVYIIDADKDGEMNIPIKKNHQTLVYLIDGDVLVNNSISLQKNNQQMIQFNNDGEGFQLQAISSSKLLFLSGEPINEKVTTYGPYVMNTQTEILEAMRDYQMGKMGFLSRN